ncbi:MAG: hypothetical protein ABIV63_21775, partial [Caldimonas sp.]
MKNVESLVARRRLGPPRAAALSALMLAAVAQAAVTDIASTPIVSTTAALVKPNIMLLMDASNSMGRTHMPDEIETQTLPTSVGYKSAQCNILYYNPATTYLLPKAYDGSLFSPPPFGAAPYAGFGAFYTVQDFSTTDLGSQFVAYDAATLEVPSPFPDTPQAGYYYVYTGTETLNYASAPCTQTDTGASNTTPGGGQWTKVNVALQSAASKANFAIWYSFYRTRIGLIKSAASLAFAPLNDTKRVGFITVQPKAAPGAPGIAGVTGNWPRFLPLADFVSTAGGQKELWFRKLFSQSPGGASPAREGLARVGRYYGGKEDSINTNMPATGPDDPVQYSCQQNFTIMTTDGYWNGQTESRGAGLYGGGLQLDGVTKVGQQDGDLSDPYSPRPFWDGASNSIHVTTNKTNAYTDNVCSLAANRFRSTFQTTRELTNTTKDTTRTSRRTVQYFEARSQAVATTVQTTYTRTSDMQTTEQFALRRQHYMEERYQHIRSQEQTTKVTEQWQLKTSQTEAQTFQTRKVDTQVWKTEEQWQTSKSQSVQTTTQYLVQVDQYKLGRKQVYKRQYQTIAKYGDDEIGVALSGDCVPGPGIRCETREIFPSQLVDPASCTTGPGPTVGPPAGYLKTTCIDGPQALAYGPVASCTPGFTAAGSGNGWVETRCDYSVGTPTAINGTCVVGPPTQDASYFIYTCTRPAANNQSVGVPSCGADTPGSSPDWITTTCTQPPGPTNYASTPSLPCVVGPPTTDANYVTTTCTKPVDTAGYAAACTDDDGTIPPYLKVTCRIDTTSNTVVPSASCSPGTVGLVTTACPKTAAGPYATSTPVQTCVDGATTGNPDYYETTCTNPPANNQTVFTTAAACGPPGVTPPSAPSWITRDCTRPPGANNDTVYADPRFCIDDPGTAFPYLRTSCTTAVTLAPVAVPPSQCPFGPNTYGGSPDFTVTICSSRGVSPPTNVAACSPTDPDVPPYVVTTCGTSLVDTPVLFCNVGDTYMDGVDTVTCVKPVGPNNAGPTQVPTCTAQAPVDPSFVRVTCAGSITTAPVAVDPALCPAPAYSNQSYVSANDILTCYN